MKLMRRMLAGLLLFTTLPVTAEVILDTLRIGEADWSCVRVVDGVDEVISRHQRQDKALTSCQSAYLADEDPDSIYEVVPARYRIVMSSDAEAQVRLRGMARRGARPIESPPPGSEDVVALGDATICTGSESNGVYTMTTDGTNDPDNGCFWPFQDITGAERHIQFQVTSQSGSSHDFAGAGAESRTGTLGAEKMTQIWVPNVGACRGKYRLNDNDPWTGGIIGDTGVAQPHCAKVYNPSFPRIEYWESSVGGTDPADWTLLDTVAITESTGEDGLACFSNDGTTHTCEFQNVVFSNDSFLVGTSSEEPPIDPDNATYGQQFDLTDNTSTNEGWPTTFPAIRTGMSWAMPPTTVPADNSGIFLNQENIPAYFEGKLLKRAFWKWNDIEAVDDTFVWTEIENDLNDANYDGVMSQFIRGVVCEIDDCNGTPIHQNEVSAPTRLCDTRPKTTESCHNGNHRITNLQIYDSVVKADREEMINTILNTPRAALGGLTVAEHPKFVAAIIKGVSASRGEEWTGSQAGLTAAEDAEIDFIEQITTSSGADVKKFAWLKEDPIRMYDAAVGQGTGWRGGAIETFLRLPYTGGNTGGNDPTTSELNCQLYTNGYLVFADPCPVVDEGRHYQDQAEAYRDSNFGGSAKWAQNYRMAVIRMGQMRRNVAWLDNNLELNPRLSNWFAVSQLGKTLDAGASAWALFGRGWTYFSGSEQVVLNLERGLLQREAYGATTFLDQADCCRLDLNFNPSAKGTPLDPSFWVWDNARLPAGSGLTLNYDNGAGGGTRTATIQDSGEVRTIYWQINDFRASAAPGNDDYDISGMGIEVERRFIDDQVSSGAQAIVMKVMYFDKTIGGKVPVIFNEVIKCGGSHPAC